MDTLAETIRATINEQQRSITLLKAQIAVKRQLYQNIVASLRHTGHTPTPHGTDKRSDNSQKTHSKNESQANVLRPLFANTNVEPPVLPVFTAPVPALTVQDVTVVAEEVADRVHAKCLALCPTLSNQTSSTAVLVQLLSPGQTCTLRSSVLMPTDILVPSHISGKPSLFVNLAISYVVKTWRRRQILPVYRAVFSDRLLGDSMCGDCEVRLSCCPLRVIPIFKSSIVAGDRTLRYFQSMLRKLPIDLCFQIVKRETSTLVAHSPLIGAQLTMKTLDVTKHGGDVYTIFCMDISAPSDLGLCRLVRRLLPHLVTSADMRTDTAEDHFLFYVQNVNQPAAYIPMLLDALARSLELFTKHKASASSKHVAETVETVHDENFSLVRLADCIHIVSKLMNELEHVRYVP